VAGDPYINNNLPDEVKVYVSHKILRFFTKEVQNDERKNNHNPPPQSPLLPAAGRKQSQEGVGRSPVISGTFNHRNGVETVPYTNRFTAIRWLRWKLFSRLAK